LLHFPDGTIFERALGVDHHRGISNPPGFAPSAVSPKDPRSVPSEQVRYQVVHNPSHNRPDTRYAQDHRVLPSIEGPPPLSQLRRQGVDQVETPQLERMSNGTSTHPLVPLHPPLEDLSGRINIIDINADRDEFSRKRKREECSTVLHERSPVQKYGNGMRTIIPRDFDKPVANFQAGRCLPQDSTNSDPAGKTTALPLREEYTLPLNEQSEVLGRQSERHPVGRARPTSILSAHYSDNSYDRERGHPHGAPVLLQESHHGFSSHNPFIKSPTFISTLGDSGNMVRSDGCTVRSNHAFPLIRPKVQIINSGNHNLTSIQKPRQQRDPGRSMIVRQNTPERHYSLSGPDAQAPNIYSRDFVQRVQSRDMKEAYRDDSQRSAPLNTQIIPTISHPTRYVPVPSDQVAFGPNDRVFTSRDMCRSSPPHASHSTSQVPLSGPRSTFQLYPDSGRRIPNQYPPQSHPSTVFRDPRNDLPLNDGRYANEGGFICDWNPPQIYYI
jgi:hypothetical protein